MSLEEKIDTASATGELVFHAFEAIVHFERRLIAERTKDDINAARLKGKKPGRLGLDTEKLNTAIIKLVELSLLPTNAARQVYPWCSTLLFESY